MSTENNPSITGLLVTLSEDVVKIQKKLDAQFIEEAKRFIQNYSNVPEAQKQFLLPSLPRQQRIAKHEVTARIAWRQEKSVGVSLSISILNLSADLRFRRETSSDSSFKIEIEQIPAFINNQKP